MTEEVKFTPGPWYVLSCGQHWNNRELEDLAICYGNDDEHICDTVYERADANLISAAPDMLREMESLAKALEDTGHEPPESFYLAIAKAYGREV